MIKKEKNGLKWLEFEILQNYPLQHAVLLKAGGYSEGAYASLNLGMNVGDNLSNVEKNKQKVASQFSLKEISYLNQCHGKEIHKISFSDRTVKNGDGLITSEKQLPLLITHADCQAAIFYDPVHHVIGNVHSGWRGSAQNIYQATIIAMHQHFKTQPKDLIVCISPSLGPESAEFKNYETELPQEFLKFQIKKNYFDFWAISLWQLSQCGILQKNVEIAFMDTLKMENEFFSYRREKITGRNGTLVTLL